jgi:hypothetical protein
MAGDISIERRRALTHARERTPRRNAIRPG